MQASETNDDVQIIGEKKGVLKTPIVSRDKILLFQKSLISGEQGTAFFS